MDPKRLEDELLRVIFEHWRPLERREGIRRAAEEPQEEPKMVSWLPRSSSETPESIPEEPKSLRRGSQEHPKGAQESPKTLLEPWSDQKRRLFIIR